MITFTVSPTAISAWTSGTLTGLGLFAVVGAQSAFILRQGLMRAHLVSIVLMCALLDAICILASVWGLHTLTTAFPWLTQTIAWFGVIFLFWYAFQSGKRALYKQGSLVAAARFHPSRNAALLAAIGFTLLNPHFWLDIMVIGSLAHSFDHARIAFGMGAITASIVWLTVLGIGSRVMAPYFSNAAAWRLIDSIIAVVMLILASQLAFNYLL